MVGNKKGVLYTLSFTLFALIIIALAALYFESSSSSESRLIELAFSQKIVDLDDSISKSISKIVYNGMNMNLDYSNTSFTVSHVGSFENSDLDDLLEGFVSNVEGDFSNVNISLDDFDSQKPIVFDSINYIVKDSKTIEIEENSKIVGYEINLSFSSNISSCVDSISGGGEFSFVFNAVSSEGGGCSFNQVGIDDVEIDMIVGGVGIDLDIEDDGELDFSANQTMNSSIKVLFDSDVVEGFSVPIEVLFSDVNFVKRSNVSLVFG
jgi:hypothetical protein